jgi:hypothetical protein
MLVEHVAVKPGTRNHKGYFVKHASGYRLVDINQAGWALICTSNTACHYVDPENLQISRSKDFPNLGDIFRAI